MASMLETAAAGLQRDLGECSKPKFRSGRCSKLQTKVKIRDLAAAGIHRNSMPRYRPELQIRAVRATRFFRLHH
jgi:hypothetical protein